jgi:hypothetical protein
MKTILAIISALSIAVCATSSASATNIVTNGDFETGDFTGWVLSGSTSAFSAATKAADLTAGTSTTNGTISQIINGLTAGNQYTVSFDLSVPVSYSYFEAIFGSETVLLSPASTSSNRFSYLATASSNSQNISFNTRADSPYSFILDNVTITEGNVPPPPPSAVPEASSWAMLIAGFGLTGAAMRRRRTVAVAA